MTEIDRAKLADELDAWHDCASGVPENGNGHFRITTLSDSDQTRINLRATLREAAAALRAPEADMKWTCPRCGAQHDPYAPDAECRAPEADAGAVAVMPRGGVTLDWHAESIQLYRANKAMRKALQEQHDWHLAQGDRDFGDGIVLNMAAEYSDSAMCERTTAVLNEVPPPGIEGYEKWKDKQVATPTAARIAAPPADAVQRWYVHYDGFGDYYKSNEPKGHIALCYDEDFADQIVAMSNAPPAASADAVREAMLPRDLPADTIAAVVGGGVTSDQVAKIWGLIRSALLLREMTGSSLTGVYALSPDATRS